MKNCKDYNSIINISEEIAAQFNYGKNQSNIIYRNACTNT